MCLECEVSAVAKRKSSTVDAPVLCAPQGSSLPLHSSRETKYPSRPPPSAISSSNTCGTADGYSLAHTSPSSTVTGTLASAHNSIVWSSKPFKDCGESTTLFGGCKIHITISQ